MLISVLDYLESTANIYTNKTAFYDTKESLTFYQLVRNAKRIGTTIAKSIDPKKPVVIYMEKRVYNIAAFMGVVYAGCFYVPLDEQMPNDRIQLIFEYLEPSLIIYDEATEKKLDSLKSSIPRISYKHAIETEEECEILEGIRKQIRNTDLLYVLFTSGSTGIPKGVTISHSAVIDFTEWICESYFLDENTSLCNQAPFYFDASVPDIYIPLKTGASLFIPPKTYYTFPKKVLQYIEQENINTLIWVPSALCHVVNCHALNVCAPKCVKLVIFCGEVMPCKHLNEWKKYLPNVQYVNMYGPTEATYACMYYNVDRDFSDEERLPLGRACENSEILLLDENDSLVEDGKIGEICIIGQCLSQGYYNLYEKTKSAFMQNPINTKWIETMYRTGDLAFKNANGDIIFAGRKDFQIKRLGHRIEIGEIENVMTSISNIESACCSFDKKSSDIIALYVGNIESEEIKSILMEKIPKYMIPNKIIALETMPMNLNGKIDRVKIKEIINEKASY